MEFAYFRNGTRLEKHDFINKAFHIQIFISLNIVSSTIKINDRFHIKCPSFENIGLNILQKGYVNDSGTRSRRSAEAWSEISLDSV